ncbi:MAG: NAD(P)/FAD-dependent oxidoreductase, partial [Spirulina sp.]
AKVLMIDKKKHPRFAIGEALTSHTERLLSLLSHQYGIPEFNYLSSFDKIQKNIEHTHCGFKRSFGFLYHQEGKPQSPSERVQWGVTRSTHFFRQEIDSYLVEVADRYGAELLSEIAVVDIEIDNRGVTVKLDNGQEVHSRYIVDASGYNSLLAKKFGLREQPSRFQTQSRSLFTHLVDVKNIDDCLAPEPEKLMPWYKGTVHHVFDGGWMWVIPFNNYDESSNPICSVGLNLSTKHFPKNKDLTPEQEFQNFLAKFPTIAAQFENARSIRPWVSTDRLQYSSSASMGERFFILPHAAGFVDPIFSSGLIHTFLTISPLAALILQACDRDDYAMSNFAPLERFQQKVFDYFDLIAKATYTSFQDFELMNVWLRVWVMQHMMSVGKLSWDSLLVLAAEDRYEYTKKDWSRFTGTDFLQSIDPLLEGWGNNYVETAAALLEKVDNNELSPEEAAAKIVSLLNSSSWLIKASGVANPTRRFFDLLKSARFGLSFLTYSFWSQWFLKKNARPFNVRVKSFIDVVRWGVEV